MKKLYFLLAFVCTTLITNAQSPELFNYQAVIRDANGDIVRNQNIAVRFEIREKYSVGIMVYAEQHQTTTNDFGLIQLHIGGGTNKTGSISGVRWGEDVHVLKIEVDFTGGSNFELLGYSQLVSVPYALWAANVSYSDTSATNELQIISLSGDSLLLSNGGVADLSKYNKSGNIKNLNDSIVIIASRLITIEQQVKIDSALLRQHLSADADLDSLNEIQTLALSGNVLSISKGNSVTLSSGAASIDNDTTNEIQSITLSGNTLTLNRGGGSINMSVFLDNTDAQLLSLSNDTVFLSNGGFIVLPPSAFDGDSSSTNELQTLAIMGNTLSISGGNSVTLPAGAASMDNDTTNELITAFGLIGDTLSVIDAGGVRKVDLSGYRDNTDAQTLNLSGSTLSISGGNSVTLPSGTVNLDNDSTNEIQDLQLVGSALSITKNSAATVINLAPFMGANTDSQQLSISNDTIYLTNGGSIKLPADQVNDADADSSNEIQTVALSSNTLSLSKGGGNVNLAPYLDNTDGQTLNLSGTTLSISGGNSVTLPSGTVSNDNDSTNELITSFALSGSNLAVTDAGGVKTVNLGSFLDNTDGQTLNLSGTTLSISGGNSVTLPSGTVSNDNDSTNEIQSLSIASNTLSLSKGGGNVNLVPYLDNTDGQTLNLSGSTLSISGGNSVTLPSGTVSNDNDSTNEIQSLSIASNTLSLSKGGGNVNLAPYLDNTDAQTLSLTGATLSISGGNSVSIPTAAANLDNDSTNELNSAFALSGSTLSITDAGGAKSVNLSTFLDNTDAQTLNLSGTTLSISGGNSVTLPTGSSVWSTSGTTAYYSTGNVGIGTSSPSSLFTVAGAIESQSIKLTTGAGNGKVLTSDGSGNATWQNAASLSLGDTTQIADTDGDTKVQTEKTANLNQINFTLGGTEQWIMKNARLEPKNTGLSVFIGENAGLNDDHSNNNNAFIGYNSGYANTTGASNSAFGGYSLRYNTTGYDNTALGYISLYLNTTGIRNTAIGRSALQQNTTASYNTGVGFYAGYANTTGSYNTSLGAYCLYLNTTGTYNTASGYIALRSNTTGYRNSAFGVMSLYGNSTGYNNSAIGMYAMYSNTSGYENTAIGYNALRTQNNGYQNNALGVNALYALSNGYQNDAIGYEALRFTTAGYKNAAIGYRAGYRNTNGITNTFLGAEADVPASTSYSNVTMIGYNTKATASNQVRLGDANVTSIGGQVGWTTVSDARFKTRIKEDVKGLDFILKLRPVTYRLDIEKINAFIGAEGEINQAKAQQTQTGFIAQEVEEAATQSGYSFSGVDAPKNENDYYGLRYGEFVVPLVKGMQEQQALIEAQQQQIEQLLKRLEALEKAK